MERYVWDKGLLMVLVICLSITVFAIDQDCSPGDFKIPRFGDNCQYRCRCNSDEQCDRITGSCANGCAPDWMGPGCQYRNVARRKISLRQSGKAPNETFRGRLAIDGNRGTCSMTDVTRTPGNQSWAIQLDISYLMYGVVIKIPSQHTDRFRNFKIYAQDTVYNQDHFLVYQHPNIPGSTEMEIIFQSPKYNRGVRIELGVPDQALSLCEVEIYAGRHLSYRMETNQSTTYSIWSSSKAVDGRSLTVNETSGHQLSSTCSATTSTSPQSWSVYLKQLFLISGVQIYARPSVEAQTEAISVLIYDNGSSQSLITYPDSITNLNEYLPKKIENDNPKYGQVLKIQRSNKYVSMTLCEVEIYGECANDTCGWNCSDVCHCKGIMTGSYRLNGTCPYGCKDRWTGRNNRCDTECTKDQWGTGCNNSCGHCLGGVPCDVISGECPSGCQTGWRNLLCDENCNNSTYGPNCSLTCGNCKDGAQCDVYNGNCSQGCAAGWRGWLCNETCHNGTYGLKCFERCGHCLEGSTCNHVTGTCSHGCAIGYEGTKCNEDCSNRTFGLNCREPCGECAAGAACSPKTGVCSGGCAAGWRGQLCNLTCPNGTYGLECSERCGHCLESSTCNHVTGTCSHGCAIGYEGTKCDKDCSSRTFGLNCRESCGECAAGAVCSPKTGVCSGGCAAGWRGQLCNLTCPNGTFGGNCSRSCGRCADAFCHYETGLCPLGCASEYQGSMCDELVAPSSPTMMVVLIAVSAVLVVVILVIVFAVYKRRRADRAHKDRGDARTTQTSEEKEKVAAVISKSKAAAQGGESERLVTSIEDNKVHMNVESTAIIVSSLKHFCADARKDPSGIYQEFQNLPRGLQYETNKALFSKGKNRYKDMYPFENPSLLINDRALFTQTLNLLIKPVSGLTDDKNVVVLPLLPDVEGSDYINASYIDGYKKPKAYIAAQGATDNTVDDIWRMIWSHRVAVIVMLTRCREMGKLKCVQYWPVSGQQEYGEINVTLEKEDVYCNYTVRSFSVTKDDSTESLRTVQFHFTGWPDKDVPDTVISLVQFWRLVAQSQESDTRPWMVHCSAGIGRTGTFIALDYLYEQGKEEEVVDVFEFVNALRQQRVNMVQTREQYLYLHQATKEALVSCGVVCDVESFPNKWFSMNRPQPDSEMSQLQTEYLNLLEEVEEPTEENQYANVETFASSDPFSGSRSRENLEKCRCTYILPADLYRPRLLIPVDGHNDFINAVKMNTHCMNDRLILTTSPLEGTVVDCARLIWQFQVTTIVIMDAITPEDDLIWPCETGDINHLGPFSVKFISQSNTEGVTAKVFEISYTESVEPLTVCRFHMTRDLDLSDSSDILKLLVEVDTWNKTTDTDMRILVQCLDGATKSGLFSVLWSALERVKTDRTVALADTVRLARVVRREIIPTFEQYQFCWKVVKDYLESFELYGNVV